jgi:hypothetical protein
MVPEHELLERFLRGEAELEAVARAMSFDGGILSVKGPPYSAEEQTVVDRITALAARIQAIEAAERLLAPPTATTQEIHVWAPPDDQQNFCVSIEVILQGSDAERAYVKSMRVYVCTPGWLAERAHRHGWTWNPAPLVVSGWSPASIREAIATLVDAGGDRTWTEFRERMSRYMEPEG